MVGGTFAWHAKFQKFKVRVIDAGHPSMQGLPKEWEKEDECYFAKELYPGTKTLLAHDITTLNTSDTAQKNLIVKHSGGYSELYPAAWTHEFDGGHSWFTALGHDKKDYEDTVYIRHLFQGIRYIATQVKRLDFGKAYANTRDSEIRH